MGFSDPSRDGLGRGSGSVRLDLGESEDFREIFLIVKKAVKAIIGKERAGLMLVLADLPPNIVALHSFGSNSIVMNRLALEAMRAGARDEIEVKSYIFVALLHEYLHSLGHIDEEQTRELVYGICRELFGEDHHATRIAARGPVELLELLEGTMARTDLGGRPPKIVKGFDPVYMGYIH